MNKKVATLFIAALLPFAAKAQQWSIETNLVDWLYLGGINVEAGKSVSRHLSLMAGARCNPWTFHSGEDRVIRNQQATIYAGARYWPWYVFSGWWLSGKAQYQPYSAKTGIWRTALEEGKNGVGVGIGGGYTRMLSKNFNMEVGIGVWGGVFPDYTLYGSPEKLVVRESGAKGFFRLDNVSFSIMYVF